MTRPGPRSDTLARVPFPFRRKSKDLVSAAVAAVEDQSEDGSSESPVRRTPSKRELGKPTPKRGQRRLVEPPPANRREAYRRLRDREKEERAERRRGAVEGDERFMLKRDRGPERALVRDIVDHRMTAGTWFFAGALVVLVGTSSAMPIEVRVASNVIWMALAAATVVDSFLITRKIKTLMAARFPRSEEKVRRLYYYGVLRAITFRRMRMPRPRIKLGEQF